MHSCCSCVASSSNNNCRQEDDSEALSHRFQQQITHRPYQCHVCRQLAWNHANVCTVCHYTCHDRCLSKVDVSCLPLVSYQLISALALERRMSTFKLAPVIGRKSDEEHPLQLELTYITERVIGLLFPSGEHEVTYRSSIYDAGLMLKSRHGNNCMMINLSSRRDDLSKIQNQILEFGWPETLAPSLERLCSICKLIDQWLNADPKNVLVLHCKGGLGRMGVALSAYIDYCSICASDDQAMDQFAMKHFCDTKLGEYTLPSQRRYAHYFAGLLSGAIRANRLPLFLYKVRMHGLPSFGGRSNCCIFVKIYQAMIPIYVSGIYRAACSGTTIFLNSLDSCLQLRGDVILKCFYKPLVSQPSSSSRDELLFQCQFHTCAITGNQLKFSRCDLDATFSDLPFSDDGQVELFFADSPDDIDKYDTVDEPSVLIESSPSRFVRQWNSYEDLSSLADESPTSSSSYQFDMQHTNGSLQGDFYTPGSGVRTGMQKPNQNHIFMGSNELNKKGNATGVSPRADFSLGEGSSASADAMTLNRSNSRFLQKDTSEDVPLDDILRELMQEQKSLNSCKTFDNSRHHLAAKHSLSSNTGTVGGKLITDNCWLAVDSGPGQSQIMKGTVSRSTVQRSPQETECNKWGLSKPCMWSNAETRTGTTGRDHSYTVETPGQRLVKMLSQEENDPHFHIRSPDHPSTSKENFHFNALGLNGTVQRPHDTLVRSKSYGYRNCASDTEDQMSWLEEQHSKLQSKREGAVLKHRTQQERRLISELKTAQNTIRSNKRSQSDTEDMSPDRRDDFRAHLQNARAVDHYRENIGTGNGRGYTDQTVRNPAHGVEFSSNQHGAKIGNSHHIENRMQILQLSPDHLQRISGLRNDQRSYESSMSNGFGSPASPATPVRGESSRLAVKQANESSITNGPDVSNLDELERTVKMTLQTMSKSKSAVTNGSQGFASSDIQSSWNQKENNSPVNAPTKKQAPNLDEAENQEVIELKPIGQGVKTLEHGTKSQPSSTSYPVQVVVSPFPLSPITAYDNSGLSTVRRGITSSASVPLSLSSTMMHTGSSVQSPMSTVSEREDNITSDLHQQQQAIKQQLLQQQERQQQLQQQLQQLQQLQQQHQLLKQKLQEHRQQQQLIQQQQQHVEPRIQYQLLQQQQMFEQQLLQQQQQLLSMQQQLQQQHQVQQLQGESQQRVQPHQEQITISEGNSPYKNERSVSTSMQRTINQNQNYKSAAIPSNSPESEGRNNMGYTWQMSRLENSGTGFPQNSFLQKTDTVEQQKMQQVTGSMTVMEPFVERHQKLGRTPSAQQTASCSRQQMESIPNSTQQFSNIQRQHQMQQQLQFQKQHQDLLSSQQQKLQKYDQKTTVRSPGHGAGKEIVEDVIEKVHAVICGGDRGIPPLETVFGEREKRAHQSPYATQLQGITAGKQTMEGLTIDTAPPLQAVVKSPSASADSNQGLLLPNQFVTSPCAAPSTLQRTLSGPGSPNSIGSRTESITSQDFTDGMFQTPRFVRDNSQYWHKPNLTRDEVIAFLKDKPPGSFIIRNSSTFQGAYGLAIKVAQIPPNIQPRIAGDPETELVRHFLIESSPKGVRLKGCSNEPTFGSLAALVYQHSITPLALPCKLLLPEMAEVSDNDTVDARPPGSVKSEGLIIASNVLYISSVDLESLTGPEAVSRAMEKTFNSEKSPAITEVHFKVTSVGITLTDNKRRLFFRRHYPFNTITHCGLEAKDQRWTIKDESEKSISVGRVFGFVARKLGSTTENSCHLFSELDFNQPASSIVNAVTNVLICGDSSAKS